MNPLNRIFAILAIFAALVFGTLTACNGHQPNQIIVEIVQPTDQQKFEEVLRKQGLKFRRDDQNRFVVEAESIEWLKARTAAYSAWEAAKYQVEDLDKQ
jgi:hypothetical protein